MRLLTIGIVLLLLKCSLAQTPFVTGYAERWSNPSGQPATFYLSGASDPQAQLHVYNVHNESVATIIAPLEPQTVAEGITETWREGFGFQPQTLVLPDLPNGVYKLDGPEFTRNYVPFLVGDPNEDTDIVVIYPTNTVTAYSRSDGVNLYQLLPETRRQPEAVSFHRPQDSTATPPKIFRTGGLDRLLLTMDHSVNYISDADLESYDAISGAKLVIIPGHSEYWTENARRNFDQFVDRGGSALVLSGNTMYRKVDYDDPENPTQLTFSPRLQFTTESVGYQTYESIGVDFKHAGNGSAWASSVPHINMPYDGWKILDASPSYLASEGVQAGDIIHDPAAEFDGVPFTECDPVTGPIIDYDRLGFERIDLIAFENTTFDGVEETCASWVDFNKTADSGRVITVGSVEAALLAGNQWQLKRAIATNMIELLLNEQGDFDGNEQLTPVDLNMLFAETRAVEPKMRYDLTEDGFVNTEDIDRWLARFAYTEPGDLNVDQTISFADFLIFADNYLKQNATYSDGDINGDMIVDFADFLVLSDNYGFGIVLSEPAGETHSTPEPAAAILIAIASTVMAFVRRKSRSEANRLV